MKACVFPGQGAQYTGMGLSLYQSMPKAKYMFEKANDILGFNIADIMFYGSEEDLTRTKVTQPAIFLHSTILTMCMGDDFCPDMVAGHSLGEFSALVANKCLKFEDGLHLVAQRAMAMQKACEENESGMAAVTNLNSDIISNICKSISPEIVVAANYNHPNQTVGSRGKKGASSQSGRSLSFSFDGKSKKLFGISHRTYSFLSACVSYIPKLYGHALNGRGRDKSQPYSPAHRSCKMDANHTKYDTRRCYRFYRNRSGGNIKKHN